MGPSEPNRQSVLSLACVGFLSALAFSAVQPVLPLYVESFYVSYEKIGVLFSAYSLTWTALQVYTGHLADRFGRKRLALVGFAIYAAFAGLNYDVPFPACALFLGSAGILFRLFPSNYRQEGVCTQEL